MLLIGLDFSVACMGSFGPNCSDPCPAGYFGHGCRRRCTCAVHEECDPKIGCDIKCKRNQEKEIKNDNTICIIYLVVYTRHFS